MKRRAPETPNHQTMVVPFELRKFEYREAREGSGTQEVVFEGYASVFDTEYPVAGGPPYGWVESITSEAFDETLAEDPDVVFLINHEGLPLARTRSETLELRVDDHGLVVTTVLDLADPDVARLVPKLERGDLDEMSFAFRVTSQEWEAHEDYPEDEMSRRRVTGVNLHRGDVSIVTFGANSDTIGELVSNALRSGEMSAGDLSELLVKHNEDDSQRDTESDEGNNGDDDADGGIPLVVVLADIDY